MMRKHKSAWLLGLLFGASWAAMSQVKTEVYWFVNTAKVEGPSYLIGESTQPTLLVLLVLMATLCLLRDQSGRVLASMGAATCLIFCVDSAQIAYRSARMLSVAGAFAPGFTGVAHESLWTQIVGASISFSLSALCLWLCVRAAGPKQPRPLARWRDWLSWNGVRTAHSEESLDVFPSP